MFIPLANSPRMRLCVQWKIVKQLKRETECERFAFLWTLLKLRKREKKIRKPRVICPRVTILLIYWFSLLRQKLECQLKLFISIETPHSFVCFVGWWAFKRGDNDESLDTTNPMFDRLALHTQTSTRLVKRRKIKFFHMKESLEPNRIEKISQFHVVYRLGCCFRDSFYCWERGAMRFTVLNNASKID